MKKIAIVSLMALSLNLGASLDPKPIHIRALKTLSNIASFAGAALCTGAAYARIGAYSVAKGAQRQIRSVDWEKRCPRTIAVILYTADKCDSAKKSISKFTMPPIRFFAGGIRSMINGFKDWMSVDQY